MDAPQPPHGDTPLQALAEARQQRSRALACLGLSLVVSLATLLANFRDHSGDWNDLRQRIAIHERLLEKADGLRQANLRVLQENREELARVSHAVGHSRP